MFYERNGDRIEIKLNRKTEPFKTVWVNDEYNSESFGTKLIKSIVGKDRFSYPKSLYATKDCLLFALADKPDAVVLDFFAGSGTTMHAVHLLNAEDGGDRRCIIVTNNEISESEEKEFIEQGVCKGSPEWEEKGIARYVTWPRIVNSIMGIDYEGKPLAGQYLTSKVTKAEIKKTYIHINYISNPMELKKVQKKKLLASLCKGKLPQNVIGDNCKFAYSENSKYTATVLFDDTAIDEWIEHIKVNDNIDTFYIITSKPSVFKKAKEKIEAVFEPRFENVPVKIPMSTGFNANVKYFKCDWTPRKPEEYLLSNALCCHIREMIELKNAIEIDNKKML